MTELDKYDELYLKAKNLIKEYNPCSIENGMCLRGKAGKTNFCCSFCEHLEEGKGCKIESLFCALWLCKEAEKALFSTSFFEKRDEIIKEACTNKMYNQSFRASKKNVFRNLKSEEL